MTSGVPSSNPRSHRGRRAGLTALLAGSLIAGGIVVATTVANPVAAEPTYQPQGTLTLQTRNNVTTASLDGAIQTFTTTGQCQLASSGSPLLRFSAKVDSKDGNVGFQSGTFGVAEKPSGASCVEVNANRQSTIETLIIQLGGSDLFPLQATSATLDIEAKGSGAKATVEFVLGGSTKGTQVVDCNATTSDAGPDAKNGDNCIETVALANGAAFDELRISASSGASVSLEGGQDWVGSSTPNVSTTFQVGYFGEAPVACESRTVQVAGSATTPAVQVREVSTSIGDCQGFVYSLTSTGGQATFLKPYSEQSERLQFMMDLEWAIAPGEVAALPPVKFGFHDKDLNPGDPEELGWCANSDFELANGRQPTITSDMDTETNEALFPGIQYACMMPPTLRTTDGTPTSWFQSIYVHGDAYARR